MSPCKTWLLHFSTLKELWALLLCTPAAESWKKTSRLAAFHHITVKFFMRWVKLPQPKPFLWPSDDKVAVLSAGHAIKPNITKETTLILKPQMTPEKTWPTAVKQKCWDHTLHLKKKQKNEKHFDEILVVISKHGCNAGGERKHRAVFWFQGVFRHALHATRNRATGNCQAVNRWHELLMRKVGTSAMTKTLIRRDMHNGVIHYGVHTEEA